MFSKTILNVKQSLAMSLVWFSAACFG